MMNLFPVGRKKEKAWVINESEVGRGVKKKENVQRGFICVFFIIIT